MDGEFEPLPTPELTMDPNIMHTTTAKNATSPKAISVTRNVKLRMEITGTMGDGSVDFPNSA